MFVSMLECEMCWHDEAVKGLRSLSEMKECSHVAICYAIPLSHITLPR